MTIKSQIFYDEESDIATESLDDYLETNSIKRNDIIKIYYTHDGYVHYIFLVYEVK